ncbi:hypothetical protein TorRG33x02_312860 [Trema orientale]|uniref:Uncharacterized protein n=1 Tax=Trema orientale TaxID=63057 RepID=A0A2P5BQ19_TREOI|nr:hypothetical protein TorRG33x02_312860 [Trema orientale]
MPRAKAPSRRHQNVFENFEALLSMHFMSLRWGIENASNFRSCFDSSSMLVNIRSENRSMVVRLKAVRLKSFD